MHNNQYSLHVQAARRIIVLCYIYAKLSPCLCKSVVSSRGNNQRLSCGIYPRQLRLLVARIPAFPGLFKLQTLSPNKRIRAGQLELASGSGPMKPLQSP